MDHHVQVMSPPCLTALNGRRMCSLRSKTCTAKGRTCVVASDLAQQHPLLSYQIRANYRHHQAHVYTVTPGPVP